MPYISKRPRGNRGIDLEQIREHRQCFPYEEKFVWEAFKQCKPNFKASPWLVTENLCLTWILSQIRNHILGTAMWPNTFGMLVPRRRYWLLLFSESLS